MTDEMGKKAALLSSVEIGLGSLLHAFSIPAAGHFLSLNQGLILTRASIETGDRRAPVLISTASALLKSLSPAGKKLTPMLAISVQGQLFGLGIYLLGNNFAGHLLGMTLLGLWGFIQPLALYFLIFGKDLVALFRFYLIETNKWISVTEDDILKIVLTCLALKFVLGIACVILAHRIKPESLARYSEWIKNRAPAMKPKMNRSSNSVYRNSLQDLFQPIFLFSYGLMLLFYFYSGSSHAEIIWWSLRPLAIAYLLFLAIRIFPVERVSNFLKLKSPALGATLDHAIKVIRKNQT